MALSADFQQKIYRLEVNGMIYSSAEMEKKSITQITCLVGIIQNWKESFKDNHKLKAFITTKTTLQEMLKGFL